MFCAISGSPPIYPVVSKTSGLIYEKQLILKYIRDNEGKDPVTGETLSEEDLVDVKTSPSAPAVPPRPASFTSIPSLLQAMQSEWDASMLEVFELRKVSQSLKQELSHALYKQDAAMRVLARVMRERDEAREALANVQSTLGISSSANNVANNGDVEMESAAAPETSGLQGDAASRITATHDSLSSTRRKRKVPADYIKAEQLSAFAQIESIPSLHSTKPPGISTLDVAQNGNLLLTGGMDKNLLVYDRSTKKTLATLKGHTKKVTAAFFLNAAADGDDLPPTLVSASADKTIRLWKTTPADSKAKAAYVAAATISHHSDEVTGIAVHPCQSLVASASLDKTWALHDLSLESGPEVVTSMDLDEEHGGATAIAFHPDGHLLAVGCQNSSIIIYDIKQLTVAKVFQPEAASGAVNSISFSENGYIMATSTDAAQAEISVWDLRKLVLLKTLPASGEDQQLSGVHWDPSGQFLAAFGSTLRIFQYKQWDAPILTYDENAADLTGARFVNEGKHIIIAGIDRTVRILGTAE